MHFILEPLAIINSTILIVKFTMSVSHPVKLLSLILGAILISLNNCLNSWFKALRLWRKFGCYFFCVFGYFFCCVLIFIVEIIILSGHILNALIKLIRILIFVDNMMIYIYVYSSIHCGYWSIGIHILN